CREDIGMKRVSRRIGFGRDINREQGKHSKNQSRAALAHAHAFGGESHLRHFDSPKSEHARGKGVGAPKSHSSAVQQVALMQIKGERRQKSSSTFILVIT